jgi:hypothetical protein
MTTYLLEPYLVRLVTAHLIYLRTAQPTEFFTGMRVLRLTGLG